MTIIEYVFCGLVIFMMFIAGLILHKLGTIRKWQLVEEKENL